MARECNIDLEKWEVADNIDLFYMVQDFEEYFEMKFQRKPVLVKKGNESTAADMKIKRMGGGKPPQGSASTTPSTRSTTTKATDREAGGERKRQGPGMAR